MGRIIEALVHRRAMGRLRRARARAETDDLLALRKTRAQIRELRREADRVLHVADGRLSLPLTGSNAILKPLHSDWAYRPELWRGPIGHPGVAGVENRTRFGGEVQIFHDCAHSELTVRQVRNARGDDLAPFGLRMDMFRFDGSFLSLVLELPGAALKGLQRRHLMRLTLVVDMESPLEIFARLNIKHGPNSEQLVRELELVEGCAEVDFDLASTNLNEKRLEKAWVDLIFEGPQMNQITLRDVTLSRRPRAEV